MPTEKKDEKPKRVKMRVRALKLGYYGDKRRRENDVFTIEGTARKGDGYPDSFSDRWMEKVAASTPEQITTGNAALRNQHSEIMSERAADRTGPDNATGAADVL